MRYIYAAVVKFDASTATMQTRTDDDSIIEALAFIEQHVREGVAGQSPRVLSAVVHDTRDGETWHFTVRRRGLRTAQLVTMCDGGSIVHHEFVL